MFFIRLVTAAVVAASASGGLSVPSTLGPASSASAPGAAELPESNSGAERLPELGSDSQPLARRSRRFSRARDTDPGYPEPTPGGDDQGYGRTACVTPMGACQLPNAPAGLPCYCMSQFGPILGVSRQY